MGTIVWLSSELMFFAALFAMYFTIRSVDIGLGKPWPPVHLDLRLATINTLVLLLSSVTCQMGVFAIERGQIRRTKSDPQPDVLGAARVVRADLRDGLLLRPAARATSTSTSIREQHLTLSDSNYGSVFYIPTGFHGLHVAGGLVAFLFLLGRTFAAKRLTHEMQVSAIVVSYYWHFVDVVWIGLFTTIYLIH